MAIKNKVQLITYPDSLGGNLENLESVLNQYFTDLFQGGVHILPPFPSSGDRGFAPLTYFEIAKEFGSWENIKAIAAKNDIMIDLMVNHISQKSEYFQDYLQNGKDSVYADLFLNLNKIWEEGNPKMEDIDKMFLRRTLPYSEFEMGSDKNKEKVWTTFGKQDPSEQIDFDINSPIFKDLLVRILQNFKDNNIKMVRLDAVGYVIKKLGTSCFWVEPDVYTFLDSVKKIADELEIELLPEVHSHYSIQNGLADHGYWIYDFILPYTVLDALINQNTKKLFEYVAKRPHQQFTMLDCHDGIPVKPDLDTIVTTTEARKLVDICVERGANLSYIFSDKHKDADGFDIHQIRCSYYSMLNANDDAYIAARAIQFFVPGIPQVYYVGALAGENDVENVLKTGEGREINRHNFSISEIETAVNKPVVKRLFKLINFRNNIEAFNGSFEVLSDNEEKIAFKWTKDNSYCLLTVDVVKYISVVENVDGEGNKETIIF